MKGETNRKRERDIEGEGEAEDTEKDGKRKGET